MAQHFDVTIVGMGASGLISGALLAKRGKRVLLVDHGEDPSTYRRKGLRLPLLPRLIPNLETMPHAQRVHDELGIAPDVRAGTEALNPSFQALMPGHRMDIPSDPKRLVEEVRAEYPEIANAVETFFQRLFALDDEISAYLEKQSPLPPVGWRQKLKSRNALAQAAVWDTPFEEHDLFRDIPQDHPVREILVGPLTFFGHLPTDTPSTFHAVRLIARYFRGVVAFEDRLGGWHGMLARAAERVGVDIRRGAMVKRVKLDGKTVRGIAIADDRLEYTTDFFVHNTLGPFDTLLEPGEAHSKYTKEARSVRAEGSLLTINLVVDKNVLPKGMANAAFLLNGRRSERDEEPADPPMFLRRFPALRGELQGNSASQVIEDADRVVLSIACPTRTDDVRHTPAKFAALKEQMTARVERVVPYLRDYLKDTSLPVDTSGWDPEGNPTQRVDPWLLHPIYKTTSRPLLGIAARPAKSYYKNLWHAGRDVLPGLGIEGEYITGAVVADQVLSQAAK